ncbi:MAG: tetratricopeptide repeat protein [Polyangiales bacterium]
MGVRHAAALAFAVVAIGCAHPKPYPVVRYLDGERYEGSFISPYSYEAFVRGELAMADGHPNTAIDHYEDALAGSGDDPFLLARLAEAHEAAGHKRSADDVLSSGLRAFPRGEALHLARGRILEGRDRLAAAAASYAYAVESAPLSERGPLALADVFRRMGEPARAALVLERLVARSPRGATAGLAAALELAVLEHNHDEAIRVAERLMHRSPREAQRVASVAGSLLDRGQAEAAARLFAALPENVGDPRDRLRAFIATHRTDEAEAWLRSHDESALGGRLAVAAAFVDIGKPAAGLELLETPRGVAPSPAVAFVRARAHIATGDFNSALTDLSQIPAGSSVSDKSHALLCEALAARGLPALADELAGAYSKSASCDVGRRKVDSNTVRSSASP